MSPPQSPTPPLPEPYWTALWADPEISQGRDEQRPSEAEKPPLAEAEPELSDA